MCQEVSACEKISLHDTWQVWIKGSSFTTWNQAFSLHLSGVAEAHGAVGVRIGQQSLAKVVHTLVQLIWNVGRLTRNTQADGRLNIPKQTKKSDVILFACLVKSSYLHSDTWKTFTIWNAIISGFNFLVGICSRDYETSSCLAITGAAGAKPPK